MMYAGYTIIGIMLTGYVIGMVGSWIRDDRIASCLQFVWGTLLVIAVLLLTGCAFHPIGQVYYHTGVNRMAYKPPLLPVSVYNPFSPQQGNPQRVIQ